jgi:hypothetical protein
MPRHLPWIKHWVGAIHDPVLLELTLAERGAWFSLEGLAGEFNADGRLSSGGHPLTLIQIGKCLHLDNDDQAVLESMVTKMVAAGPLAWNIETLYFTNWATDQALPHWLTPEGMAERQRESRARRFGSLNNVPPSPLKEGEGEGEGHVTVTVTRGNEARGHWKKVMARLQRHMTKANFATWLKGSRGLGYDPDGLLVVEVQSRFAVDNLNRSLYSLTRRALMEVTGGPADIQFICPEQLHVKEAHESPAKRHQRDRAPAGARRH